MLIARTLFIPNFREVRSGIFIILAFKYVSLYSADKLLAGIYTHLSAYVNHEKVQEII